MRQNRADRQKKQREIQEVSRGRMSGGGRRLPNKAVARPRKKSLRWLTYHVGQQVAGMESILVISDLYSVFSRESRISPDTEVRTAKESGTFCYRVNIYPTRRT